MSDFMKSDAALDRDVNAANTPDEIKELLYRAVERSQIGYTRDPVSGRFVSTGDPAQRQADTAAEPQTYTRSVEIGGRTFDFTANDPETLEVQINSAREVYRHLENNRESAAVDEPTAAEIEAAHQRKLFNDTQAQLEFQRGEISVKEYLEKTGAVGDYLASQGVDIDALREQAQRTEVQSFEQNWSDAVQEFLKNSDWPGGSRNMKLCQQYLGAMNLADEPSAESIRKAYQAMQRDGVIFPSEVELTQADVLKATEKMSPAELLEIWKQGQLDGTGSAEKANASFISAFRRK
jgi:hypothetical protein